MSGPNSYDYLDNFDDNRDVREYRRRHKPAQQSGGARRPQGSRRTPPSGSRPPRGTRPQGGGRPPMGRPHKRNNRRIRNRVIIIAFIVIIAAVLVLLLSTMFRGCSGGDDKLATMSTETVAANTGSSAAQSSAAQNTAAQSDDLSPTYFTTPSIDDDNTDGTLSYSIYVWQNSGFEIFGSDEERAQTYAETINSLANKLEEAVSGIKVYDMMVPNHTEMGLPQRLQTEAGSSSQADNIKAAYAALSSNVTPINCYNYLANHNTEYIYFKSDHHWTALGAYYAYKAFTDTNGLSALSLDDCTENKIDGFTGSFTNTASGLDEDTVSYYTLPYDVSMEVTPSSGDIVTYESPYYSASTSGSYTYSVFILGDNPLAVLKSSSENAEDGKKIVVVKESYGNAFVPFLTYNYQEVHVVDFRYFKDTLNQTLTDYCKENEIDEVLFLNGVMSANTQTQLDSMTGMFE